MRIVNMEPFGYSKLAKQKFVSAGWEYVESGWEQDSQCQENAMALIIRLSKKVDRTELDRFPNLKYLLSATTGLDHINFGVLNERGIQLVSLRGENRFLQTIPSTAEHAWALLLSLVRNIPWAVTNVDLGSWNRDAFRGYQMKDKRLGIIGMGRTGQKVASYAKAFGMEVGYYDPYVHTDEHSRFERLEDLLVTSDVISLHVHLNDETRNMLNKENIRQIKKGAIVINTSRGAVLDENALVDALSKDLVGGIATDVLATELYDVTASPLWQARHEGRRVIITPHIGGATWDAMWACEEFIADKFLDIQK